MLIVNISNKKSVVTTRSDLIRINDTIKVGERIVRVFVTYNEEEDVQASEPGGGLNKGGVHPFTVFSHVLPIICPPFVAQAPPHSLKLFQFIIVLQMLDFRMVSV